MNKLLKHGNRNFIHRSLTLYLKNYILKNVYSVKNILAATSSLGLPQEITTAVCNC